MDILFVYLFSYFKNKGYYYIDQKSVQKLDAICDLPPSISSIWTNCFVKKWISKSYVVSTLLLYEFLK